MDLGIGISLGALLVSLTTLIFGAMAFSRTATRTEVGLLEKDLADCQAECRRLRADNVELLRRLVKLSP